MNPPKLPCMHGLLPHTGSHASTTCSPTHTGLTSTNEGTDTTAPVSRVAFLVPAPEAVLPFTPGGVSVICVNSQGRRSERDGTEFSSDATRMIIFACYSHALLHATPRLPTTRSTNCGGSTEMTLPL